MAFESNYSGSSLEYFLETNTLPCYAYVIKNTTSNKERDKENNLAVPNLVSAKHEEIYLIDTFESDCMFARSYSADFEKMLMKQRNSFAHSDVEDLTFSSNYLTLTQARKDMISENVSIPFGYQGLFEWFCVNSQKVGGILDHETDIISLASRFEKPSFYYVAAELNVFEITSEKTSSKIFNYLNSLNKKNKNEHKTSQFNRKWTKLPIGTIVKAVRVSEYDCFNDTNIYVSLCQAAFCCRDNERKSEMVIEFKVIENFNELLKSETSEKESFSFSEAFAENTKDIKPKNKSFYVPVDVDNPNKSINLIPIAPFNKNVLVKNSLQMIKNFQNIDLHEYPNLEFKLFADNLFPEYKNFISFSKDDQLLVKESFKMNLHLEVGKLSSIFEIYENRKKCKILVGYNLDHNVLFFTNISRTCPTSKFRLNSGSSKVEHFKNKLEVIHKLAAKKIDQFNSELNKMENFSDVLQTKPINDQIFKANINRKPTISNFADLVNCDFRKGSISSESILNQHFSSNIQQLDDDSKSICNKLNEKLLIPFKLKRYHSIDEIKNSTVMIDQDLIDKVKISGSNNCNDIYTRKKVKNNSLDLTDIRQSSIQKNLKSQKEASRVTNLNLARSLSLPSILMPSKNIFPYCKKNIL